MKGDLSTIFIFIFFSFLIMRSTNALSFNYSLINNAGGDDSISLAHDFATFVNNTISVERVMYYKPMQLWDSSSGNLTDFQTHFTFVFDSQNRSYYRDGSAFFLAPVGSRIPSNLTQGGSLGLTNDDQILNSTGNPFLAVEFDIYRDSWDPPGTHVGININSMRSVANVSWMSDVRGGKTNEAWVNYDSKTRNLSVIFTGYQNDTSKTEILQHLSYVIDLRTLLPEKVIFGFSSSTDENSYTTQSLTGWSFSSSLDIAESNLTKVVARGRENKTGLATGLSVGVVLLLVGLVALIWFCLFRKKIVEEEDADLVLQYYMGTESSGPKKFSYSELASATGNFRAEEKLGQGGFGGVYKGFLKSSKSSVAVKKISSGSRQGIKEYASEVKIISRLRHRNLVQLIGWCHEKRELLLVYEFMPNGSLDLHLFKDRSLLPWDIRFKIARGLASALLYLHEEWEQLVVHRDIKSSNVMLDSEWNAKLGDFGLARLVDHAKGAQTTVVAGTMGYMAPECLRTLKASKESDMYSFGVVCLEIACGRKSIEPDLPDDQIALVDWAWELHGRDEIRNAADPRLLGDFDAQQIERLIIVGLSCTLVDSRLRLSAKQALHVLDLNSPLPDLPAKRSAPTTELPHGFPYSASHTQFDNFSYTLESR